MVSHTMVMEWLLPSLQGMVSKIGVRFDRDPGKSRRGCMGCFCIRCSETKQPSPLTRASQLVGEMKTRGSWSSIPDALPGTEFAKTVSSEAGSREFSDDIWSNRSHARLRENHIPTPDQIESSMVIWVWSKVRHNRPRPRCVA